MRKFIAFVTALVFLLLLTCSAMAAGVTLRTFTPFADLDAAAQPYMDMITAWENETGNVVEDYSGLTDEAWMNTMLDMVRSGEADVVVVPLGTGLTSEELVTVQELMEAVPDLGIQKFPAYAETDGSILLSPMRVSFEALYINTDVLKANGAAVPQTYEEMLAACSVLFGKGVTPISNALADWPEIVLDCCALAGAPADAFGSADSLNGAQRMLSALHAVGAFGSDPFSGSDMDAMQAFVEGRAAMRVDGDMLAQMIPPSRQDSVIVIPMPRRAGEENTVLCGMPGFGIGITRACWEDDARFEAAISFVRSMLTDGKTYQLLAVGADGELGKSIAQMMRGAQNCSGILYDVMQGGFDSWAQGVIDAMK